MGTPHANALSEIMNPIIPPGLYDEIYTKIVYEKHHPLKRDEVVVDVGAHIGIFTEKALNTGCVVFAFEPEPDNFSQLLRRVSHHPTVTCFQVALWSEPKQVLLNVRKDHDGGHSVKWGTDQSHQLSVAARRLDDYAISRWPKIDFIKIDAEGSELEILKGSEQVLLRDRPDLAIEMHGAPFHKPIKDFLASLSYSMTPSDLPPDAGWIAYAHASP